MEPEQISAVEIPFMLHLGGDTLHVTAELTQPVAISAWLYFEGDPAASNAGRHLPEGHIDV